MNTIHVIAGVSTNSDLLYAVVVSPYKTIDGGETWEYLTSFNFGVNPCEYSGYVDTIAIDPANTDVFLVGDDSACLVRSDDGGATLTKVYESKGVSPIPKALYVPFQLSLKRVFPPLPHWNVYPADRHALAIPLTMLDY